MMENFNSPSNEDQTNCIKHLVTSQVSIIGFKVLSLDFFSYSEHGLTLSIIQKSDNV